MTKMKARNKYIRLSAFLILITSFTACKKFVEIPPPTTELVTASVFNNDATATAAQIQIYIQMNQAGESYYMAQENGLLADELNNYSTVSNQVQYYTNALLASQNPGPWSRAYNYIYQANAIIAALTNNSAVSPAVQEQLIGESKFIRAFWHFYLTNLYGDIPLVTSTNYTVNASTVRTPQAQIYQQIITDLKDAQNLLNINYVDASDTSITSERVRPTKWAATALLARVYLYTGDYSDAAAQATTVINNTGSYSLCSNLNNVFLANSTEAIWQLQIPLPASNLATLDGNYFILVAAPGLGTNNSNTISAELLNAFENGDGRRSNWVDSIILGTNTYYFPYKYKQYQSSTAGEYVMVLRFAEQYLIRAEAEGNLGDSSGAITDLNIIRNRAGLTNYSAVNNGSLLTAIIHERQVELFTEWGHRWFDLIRTGNAIAVMGGPTGVCAAKGGTWSPNWELYPIPQSDRSNDPNLTQNVGY
jgi:starch-binding outer membrane protein, SusD/RagB family